MLALECGAIGLARIISAAAAARPTRARVSPPRANGHPADWTAAGNTGPSDGGRSLFDTYVIEFDGELAGVAKREWRGYRFHSASPACNPIDGQLFATPRAAAQAARLHAVAPA